MALTISQVTDFRLITPTDQSEDLAFRVGYHAHNESRAGEGMISNITNSGFGETSGCWDMTILVLSGTFQAGDSVTCSPAGSFVVGTIATAAHGGILVSGTMSDTDSTRNTNEALDLTEEEITVGAAGGLVAGQILRVENEYMYMLGKNSSTSINVKRGLYGTAATHDTNKDIYIVDTNLFEQILDADVSGPWGYSDTSNGRMEFDCHILLGRTDATASSVLISCKENIDLGSASDNCYYVFGKSTYRTYLSLGVGYLSSTVDDNTGVSLNASILSGSITSDVGTFQNFINSTTYFFGTSLNCAVYFRGAIIARDWSINCIDSAVKFFMVESSKAYNTFINHCSANFGSSVFEINNMFVYSPNCSGIYWVYATGDATVKNLDVSIDSKADNGFVANGVKTMINCKCSVGMGIFWGNGTQWLNYKTFDCKVLDELGNLLSGVNVRAKYWHSVYDYAYAGTAITYSQTTFWATARSTSTNINGELILMESEYMKVVSSVLPTKITANTFLYDKVDTATNKINIPGHGFLDGDRVRFTPQGGYSLPYPLAANTLYYIVQKETDYFKVSTSLNGSEVDLTWQGNGTHTITPMLELVVERGYNGSTAVYHSVNTLFSVIDSPLVIDHNIFSVATSSLGVIATQNVLFDDYTAGGYELKTRDIEYFITKPGYKTLRGRINIQNRDNPISLIKVMKKNRFRETKSYPQ